MSILGRLLLIATVVAVRSSGGDLASATFDDGTPGPFQTVGDVSFPPDSTGSGRGRVAQFRYTATETPVEIVSSLVFRPPPRFGFGSTFFFSGDLYIPRGTFNLDNSAVDRKLLTFRATGTHSDSAFDKPDVYVIVHLYACGVLMEWSGMYSGSPCRLGGFTPGRWYRIETQVTMSGSITAHDGVLRLWVNGLLAFEDTAMSFTKPTWTGAPVWQTWAIGEKRRSANYGANADLSDGSSIDELRYWDNVAFSTIRVGTRR